MSGLFKKFLLKIWLFGRKDNMGCFSHCSTKVDSWEYTIKFGGTWNPKGRGAYFCSAVWDDSSKGEQPERTARSFKLSAMYVLWTIPIQHSLTKDRRNAISSYLAFTMNIR